MYILQMGESLKKMQADIRWGFFLCLSVFVNYISIENMFL